MKKYSDSVAVGASLAFSPRIAKIDVFYVKTKQMSCFLRKIMHKVICFGAER